eukprot:2243692-Pyramimonas_sp.AAC.1
MPSGTDSCAVAGMIDLLRTQVPPPPSPPPPASPGSRSSAGRRVRPKLPLYYPCSLGGDRVTGGGERRRLSRRLRRRDAGPAREQG